MKQIADGFTLQLLAGLLPRHDMDADVGRGQADLRFRDTSRLVVDEAFAIADRICENLERQFDAFEAVEDEGLSGRLRYLTAAAVVAAVLYRYEELPEPNQVPWLRSTHSFAELRRVDMTHDISNAMSCFWLRYHGRDPADLLGTWVWMHLMNADVGRHLRWVASMMQFVGLLGWEILDAADVIARKVRPMLDAVEPVAPSVMAPDGTVTFVREDARRIAQSYLARDPIEGARVGDVRSLDEIQGRQPVPFGVDLTNCWVVYLAFPHVGLHSSTIIAVSKMTGAVRYVGSASDEG